jgi:HSP20 family protein
MLIEHLSKEFMREIGVRSRDIYEMILPAVDMFEDGSELVVMLDMAGFEKEKINTRLSENSLIVSAKRDRPERDGMTYWEQRPFRINKKILLPVKVDVDDEDQSTIKAKYENGVLSVRIPIKGVGRVVVE